MRKPMIAGNWKMHGSRESVSALVSGLLDGLENMDDTAEVMICPPSVFLADVQRQLKKSSVALAAQDLCSEEQGAFTGEVSGRMLAEFGCSAVLVGHSERRSLYGEDDRMVARKFVAAQRAGLMPVLCVGETLEEREAGDMETVVGRQLSRVIEVAGIQAFGKAVVAYEPVWAIGTGHTASPEQAQEAHAFIRGLLASHDATIADSVRLLYGGSVKAANAAEIFAQTDVDGGLVGGASLDAQEFLKIVGSA